MWFDQQHFTKLILCRRQQTDGSDTEHSTYFSIEQGWQAISLASSTATCTSGDIPIYIWKDNTCSRSSCQRGTSIPKTMYGYIAVECNIFAPILQDFGANGSLHMDVHSYLIQPWMLVQPRGEKLSFISFYFQFYLSKRKFLHTQSKGFTWRGWSNRHENGKTYMWFNLIRG